MRVLPLNQMRRFSSEIYLLYIPCCIYLILSIFFFPKFLALIAFNILDLSAFKLIVEGGILKVLGISFITLFLTRIFIDIYHKKTQPWRSYAKEFGYFLLLVGVPGFFYSSFSFFLFTHADIAKTIFYSNLFSRLDHVIFGNDLFFVMRNLSHMYFFEEIVLYSYKWIGILMSMFGIYAYFKRPIIFRKFVSAIFLCTALSIPFWYTFPAVAPASLFLTNIFRLPLTAQTIDSIENDHISPLLHKSLLEQNALYFDPTLRNIPISTNPSMHTAWGLILAFYFYQYSRRYAWIGGFYALCNILGALYIGQHYSIDILFGGIIAVLTLWIVEKVFSRRTLPSGN